MVPGSALSSWVHLTLSPWLMHLDSAATCLPAFISSFVHPLDHILIYRLVRTLLLSPLYFSGSVPGTAHHCGRDVAPSRDSANGPVAEGGGLWSTTAPRMCTDVAGRARPVRAQGRILGLRKRVRREAIPPSGKSLERLRTTQQVMAEQNLDLGARSPCT